MSTPLPTIAGGTASGGLGGVSLATRDYPGVPRAILDGIERRADAGRLDRDDERARAETVTREVRIARGRDVVTARWSGHLLREGVTATGERGRVLFIEPSLDSGTARLERAYAASRFTGEADVYALASRWSLTNDVTFRAYRAAIQDAREQAQANAAARAALDEQVTTREERAAAAASAAEARRQARIRAERIDEKLRGSDSRDARRLRDRVARIRDSTGLTGLYAKLIDDGEDVEAAAETLVPDPYAEDETPELSALDRLYPLEDDSYYLETFAELPQGWPELYLGFTGEADLPLMPDAYYVETFADLPQGWRNLYLQAQTEI